MKKTKRTATTRKPAPTEKVPAARAMAAAAERAPGTCLSLPDAGIIVQKAANGPHDVDKTLEQIGFITDELRDGFRDRVHQGVLAKGCRIDPRDIPNDADSTLRLIRNTVQQTAF